LFLGRRVLPNNWEEIQKKPQAIEKGMFVVPSNAAMERQMRVLLSVIVTISEGIADCALTGKEILSADQVVEKF
jgi:hypothetical protein